MYLGRHLASCGMAVVGWMRLRLEMPRSLVELSLVGAWYVCAGTTILSVVVLVVVDVDVQSIVVG